jgi:hypothetical protein
MKIDLFMDYWSFSLQVELLTGLGLWMDAGFTLVYRMRFSLKPKEHFIAVMKHLLGPILKLDGVSISGTRGCEPLPAGMIAKVICKYFDALFTF